MQLQFSVLLTETETETKMSGIYIHIPFCKQACHYCDFHFSTSLKKKEEMVTLKKLPQHL